MKNVDTMCVVGWVTRMEGTKGNKHTFWVYHRNGVQSEWHGENNVSSMQRKWNIDTIDHKTSKPIQNHSENFTNLLI